MLFKDIDDYENSIFQKLIYMGLIKEDASKKGTHTATLYRLGMQGEDGMPVVYLDEYDRLKEAERENEERQKTLLVEQIKSFPAMRRRNAISIILAGLAVLISLASLLFTIRN